MAHLTRRRTDAQWYTGYPPTGADFIAWDQGTFVTINGEEGGVYAPTADIVIGGAGVGICAPWTCDGNLSGVVSSTTSPVTFGKGTSDDYFQFALTHTGRAPDLAQNFFEAYSESSAEAKFDINTGNGVVCHGRYQITALGVLSTGAHFLTPVAVSSGATLTAAILTFRVGINHANVPQVLPRLRVIAVGPSGVLVLRAPDLASQTDDNGFQSFPAPASGAAWFNAGNTQAYTYTCNQNNVIDLQKYDYFVEIYDEDGTNAANGNKYDSVLALQTTTILDMRN